MEFNFHQLVTEVRRELRPLKSNGAPQLNTTTVSLATTPAFEDSNNPTRDFYYLKRDEADLPRYPAQLGVNQINLKSNSITEQETHRIHRIDQRTHPQGEDRH